MSGNRDEFGECDGSNSDDPKNKLREEVGLKSFDRRRLLRRYRFWSLIYYLGLTGLFGGIGYGAGILLVDRVPRVLTDGIPFIRGVAVISALSLATVVGGSYILSNESSRISYWFMFRLRNTVSALARQIYKRATTVFLILSLAIPLAYFGVNSDAAATATIFYATVLFFNETLLEDSAVLRFIETDFEYDRSREDEWITASHGVQNEGGADASSVSILYRVYDHTGAPLTETESAKILPEYRSLGTGEMIPAEYIFTPFPISISSDVDNQIYIHLEAKDGFGYSLVSARNRKAKSV